MLQEGVRALLVVGLRTVQRRVEDTDQPQVGARGEHVPIVVQTDKRLADLRVSQLVIDGGWIGAALGPHPIRTQLDDAARYQAPPESEIK